MQQNWFHIWKHGTESSNVIPSTECWWKSHITCAFSNASLFKRHSRFVFRLTQWAMCSLHGPPLVKVHSVSEASFVTTTRNVFLVLPFVYSLQKTLQLHYNIAFRHRYVCVLHWYIKIFKSWKDMLTGINPWVCICKLVLTMPLICFVLIGLTSIYNLNRLCS